nr:NUDIX domain-containing protein [Nitrosomonas nitrosa]
MSISAPVPAATVLLLRDDPQFQVLMVKRHHEIDFASGALVFPGGKIQTDDADDGWRDCVIDWTEFDQVQRSIRIGAIREVFEEVGLLLGEHASGGSLKSGGDPSVRAAVASGEARFLDIVREMGGRLSLSDMTPFARWITPTIMPKRFDTWFYVAHAPTHQTAACDGRETVHQEWLVPSDAVELGTSRKRTIIFPTLMNLRRLAQSESAKDCIQAASRRSLAPVLPEIEQREDGPYLTLPADSGYGAIAVPLADLMAR